LPTPSKTSPKRSRNNVSREVRAVSNDAQELSQNAQALLQDSRPLINSTLKEVRELARTSRRSQQCTPPCSRQQQRLPAQGRPAADYKLIATQSGNTSEPSSSNSNEALGAAVNNLLNNLFK
jgi:hypothetical protein